MGVRTCGHMKERTKLHKNIRLYAHTSIRPIEISYL